MATERGKQQAFTDEQLKALRDSIKEWRARPENKALSQKEVGAKIDVSQQTYSKFEAGSIGAGYHTATKIARLVGFDGIDAFFEDRGVSVPGQKRGAHIDPFHRREIAANSMIKNGLISPEAYDIVRDDPEYNRASHETKDGPQWSLILEATERALVRQKQDQTQAQERIQMANKNRAERIESERIETEKAATQTPKSKRRGAA